MRAVLPMAAVAAILLSSCSSPAPQPRPTVDFGSASVTPGMPGMSSMPMPATAAPASNEPTSSAAPVSGDAVTIENFKFAPQSLSVKVGSTVTWTNKDEEPHTVVNPGGAFRSQSLGSGGTYSFTFNTAGTFDYVCSIHPFMTGTVVVTP
jgi:amicyanin